ncbi:MAG TPA: sensor histidine kinase, partial [Polyangia bacterium]|nr:sensor histidine kinase [Polyangia bacterium]
MEQVESRRSLGEIIAGRRGDIEQGWLDRVRSEVGDRGLEASELRDAVPDYLDRLAESLRQSDNGNGNQEGEAVWADVAVEHGKTRVRQGFDIQQVVHEFVLLRKVLVDVAREEGILSDGRQQDRLVDLIEAAIAVAIKSYAESRDYQVRRKRAEDIGFITHELRNPLTTAMAAASQLRRAGLVPTQERLFQIIERNHKRLRDLIDNFLVHQRFEAEQGDPRPLPARLQSIVMDAIADARVTAEAKGIGLQVRMDFDPATIVEIDPQMTVSAIQNVVDNGVKYTDKGRVEVSIEDRSSEFIIHVRDCCGG